MAMVANLSSIGLYRGRRLKKRKPKCYAQIKHERLELEKARREVGKKS